MADLTQSPRYPYSPIWERAPLGLPDGARVAVLLYLCIEHFPWDAPQMADHMLTPATAQTAPDVLNATWRDYGPRVGLWRIVRLLERLGIPPTVMLHSDVCAEYPQIVEYGKAHGWEWVGHGANTTSVTTTMAREDERALIASVLDEIERATGERPSGWFSARISESHATPDILSELGVEYLCDYSADEQPFPVTVADGSLVSIPYNLNTVDVVMCNARAMTAEQYADALIEQFEVQFEEAAESARIMPISLHPFIAGQAFRIRQLERALAHIANHDGVWLAQARDVHQWYRAIT